MARDDMAPSNSAGVTGAAAGLAAAGTRGPEGAPVGDDGRMDVAELLAPSQGGPSPFGDDVQFPLPDITYRHPD